MEERLLTSPTECLIMAGFSTFSSFYIADIVTIVFRGNATVYCYFLIFATELMMLDWLRSLSTPWASFVLHEFLISSLARFKGDMHLLLFLLSCFLWGKVDCFCDLSRAWGPLTALAFDLDFDFTTVYLRCYFGVWSCCSCCLKFCFGDLFVDANRAEVWLLRSWIVDIGLFQFWSDDIWLYRLTPYGFFFFAGDLVTSLMAQFYRISSKFMPSI